jgi:hypothetical protein
VHAAVAWGAKSIIEARRVLLRRPGTGPRQVRDDVRSG